jgi:hypothetical protein
MKAMMPGAIPEGREPDTHSEHVNFKKVGLEPNRFEIVFSFRKFCVRNEHNGASHRSSIESAPDHTLAAFEVG